jgi:diguanylate cyclase (GGDEF)-like protein/PAS domain S-box-containing protein
MATKKSSRNNKTISTADEQTFRLMFEGHSAIMLLVEPETGVILNANQAALDFYGYSKSKLCGMLIHEINMLPPEQVAVERQKALNKERNYSIFPHKLASGEERIVEVHSSPITLQEKIVLFSIIHDITERKQAEIELHYVKESLNAANIELQSALIREQQLARSDSLTGINTRRHLLELAAHEFHIAMRYRPPLSVLMFDVDNFKQVNDSFGHAVGDQVLQRIIQIVCAGIRSVDVIGRYGGDEFVILLPQTSAQEALPLAERICANIASLRIETDKGPLTVTLSLGISQTIHRKALEPGYTPQSDSVENLFLRADRALYAAKQAGRNRIVIFTED